MNLCSGKKSQVNHNENNFVYYGSSIGEVNPVNLNQSQDTKVTNCFNESHNQMVC